MKTEQHLSVLIIDNNNNRKEGCVSVTGQVIRVSRCQDTEAWV